MVTFLNTYSANAICEGDKIDTTENTAGKIPSEKIIEQKSNIVQEFNTDFPQMDSFIHKDSFDENHDLRKNIDQVVEQDEKISTTASPMKAKECWLSEDTVWNSNDIFDNTLSFPVTCGVTKSNRIDNVKEASEDVKLHDRMSSSDSEAKDITTVGNESGIINLQSVQTRIGTGTEELIIGGSRGTTATPSLFDHLIHEDASLPGTAALYGPMITSGHIPNSGNISLRSESSTTSTHSFAFPILQPEWSSSPVKMAKADRKHSWKHRWRTALICCKF